MKLIILTLFFNTKYALSIRFLRSGNILVLDNLKGYNKKDLSN